MAEHEPQVIAQKREYLVPGSLQNRRLDLVVASLAGLTRSVSRQLVESALVMVNGRRENFPSRKVNGGDRITVFAMQTAKPAVREIKIIYEDPAVIVINKPPGMLTTREGTEMGMVLEEQLNKMGKRVFSVHRLDRDTSGIVVFAKDQKTRDHLLHAFRSRRVKKRYLAVVVGVMRRKKGVLRGIVARKEYAVTVFRVLKKMKDATLLELLPQTGRTHQIRIQLAEFGFPLVGEKKYLALPSLDALFPRHALHAAEIEYLHPVTKKMVKHFAPMPDDMKALLRKLVD